MVRSHYHPQSLYATSFMDSNIENVNNLKQNLISPSLFIKKFSLLKHGFSKATQLLDHKFGFTATKLYTNKLNEGTEYYSFISLIVDDSISTGLDIKHKPIVASIDLTEKRDGRFYITESLKSTVARPINLTSNGDYFVNLKTGNFYDNTRNRIKAEELLLSLYKLHLKPTMKFNGIFIRIKIQSWRYIVSLIKYTEIFLKYSLKILTGELYEYNHTSIVMRDETNSQKIPSLKIVKSKSVSISGFTARPHTILAYCAIHLIFFLIFYSNSQYPNLLKTIFSNGFLTVIYTVFTLGVMDRIYPFLSKWTQRHLTKLQWQMNFKSFKL